MTPKEQLKAKFSQEYEKYYLVNLFKEQGFERKTCKKCGNNFWTLQERDFCPNPPCESYGFIGKRLTAKRTYMQTWKDVERFFVENGHTSIPSYPVVCRWFPGLYFTIASIIAFQRSAGGKTVFEMPANPLVIPQQCLRFNDIPNVGVTGRHLTNFVMIGQHSIYNGNNGYWKDRCVGLDFRLLTETFGIKPEEINFVEDVWLGPNAFGYSLEYYVRGLELGNAVFTEFVGTPENYKQMDYKVIDMGAGLERFAWISQGTPTCYDAVFGRTMKRLKKLVDYDKKLFGKYARLAGNLNLDEVSDIKAAKQRVAQKLGMDAEELIRLTRPVEAIYAIADHSKTLLYAITDGGLPSNVGGGYNLRVVLRRALGFIEEFGLDIDLLDICRLHAKELKGFNPRFSQALPELEKILKIEKSRFIETKNKNRKIVENVLEKGRASTEKLIMLYESYGITPELIEETAKEKNLTIDLPPNFYSLISDRHMSEKAEEKEIVDVHGLQPTKLLFYQDRLMKEFTAKVLKIIDNRYVVLDQTCFFGKTGGQDCDTGLLNNSRVYNVEKVSGVIVHFVEQPDFSEGGTIRGRIDWERREQIMHHHSAVHVVNGAARKVLGKHVWQAGASKTVEKATLDITHYKSLTEEEIEKIEKLANKIIRKRVAVEKDVVERTKAEEMYGMTIYQGGAIPEKQLRIVKIKDFDVEACGGTHVDNTEEIGKIIIVSAERIQDGISRITLVAGNTAEKYLSEKRKLIKQTEKILGVEKEGILNEAYHLFNQWKDMKKKAEKLSENKAERIISEMERRFVKNVLVERLENFDMNSLRNVSKILSNEDRTILLFGVADKIHVFGAAGKNSQINIGQIVARACSELEGKGGGSENLAQGIGHEKGKLDAVIEKLRKELL